jgi:hypothetical protein
MSLKHRNKRPSPKEMVPKILSESKSLLSITELLALCNLECSKKNWKFYTREPLRSIAIKLQEEGLVAVVDKSGKPHGEAGKTAEMCFIWLPTIKKLTDKKVVDVVQHEKEVSPLEEEIKPKELEEEFESEDLPFIDVDAGAWEIIKQAASESKWIPKEYMMNDWVSDVCDFLRNGYPETQCVQSTLESKEVFPNVTNAMIDLGIKKLHIEME